MVKELSGISSNDVKKIIDIAKKLEHGSDQKPKKRKWEKLPTPFSLNQLRRLFNNVDNAKIIMVCFLALRTGMRLSEVLSTKVSEINWELSVINKPRTKGGRPRVYYLDKPAMYILRKWVSLLGDTEYMFPSCVGHRDWTTPTGFISEFRKHLIKARLWIIDKNREGEKHYHVYTFHSFRTTFCSILVNNGTPIYTAKLLMGHSDVRTTEKHYAVLGDLTLKRELDKVFGQNKNRLLAQLEKEKSVLKDDIVNLNKAVQPEVSNHPERDPLQVLQIKLANGDISVQEFTEKSQAIMSWRKQGGEQSSYIG